MECESEVLRTQLSPCVRKPGFRQKSGSFAARTPNQQGTMMESKPCKRIDKEIVSVDCLAHHLKEVHGCDCDVHRVPADSDPPDYWMTVDGESFAVEATSITVEAEIAYADDCKKLKNDVNKAAGALGNNIGTYALVIRGHPKIPGKQKGGQGRRNLVCQAVGFIRDTQGAPSPQEQPLLEDGRSRLTIQRLSDMGATVGLVRSPGAKWEGDIQDQLRELMNCKVVEKRQKLENKGVPAECSRIILVLYDAYGYGDIEDAQKAILQVEGREWFHSVFWAASFTDRLNELSPGEPGREGGFIYSKEDRWWRGART